MTDYHNRISSLLVFLFKRTWWILPILIIFLCFMINILQVIPYKVIPGSTDAWLGFWGAIIGTLLSVIITLYVMLYTLSYEADVRLHEKMEVIVANNFQLTEVPILDGYRDVEKVDSNVYIEFFNLGKSGIYDINYAILIKDLDSVISKSGIHYSKEDNNSYLIKYSEEYYGKNEIKHFVYSNDESKVITPTNIILLEGASIKIDLPNDLLFLLLLLSEEQTIKVEILFKLNYKNFQKNEVTNYYTIYLENLITTAASNNVYGWSKYFMSGEILACQEGERYG